MLAKYINDWHFETPTNVNVLVLRRKYLRQTKGYACLMGENAPNLPVDLGKHKEKRQKSSQYRHVLVNIL